MLVEHRVSIVTKTTVVCPSCAQRSEVELVRSLNGRDSPELKAQLLKGSLNLLVCSCGKRTQLAADTLFHDPEAAYFCQVAVGGEPAMVKSAKAFLESGVTGTLRLVPSLNGLIEKVKLLDAGLEDWAIEMSKVLLLASMGERDINTVVLFDSRDGEALRWVLFDHQTKAPQVLTSPVGPYLRGLTQWANVKPPVDELRIDRAWAVEALRRVMPMAS